MAGHQLGSPRVVELSLLGFFANWAVGSGHGKSAPTKSCRNQLAKIKLYQTWIHLTWGYFWVRPSNLTLNCRSSPLSQATSCRGGMVKKNPINGILKLGQHMSTPWCTEEHPNVPQKNVATHTHYIYMYTVICIIYIYTNIHIAM